MPLTDNPARYDDMEWVYMDKNGILEKCYISCVKHFKNLVILKIKGVDSIEAAEALKGFYLMVDRQNAVKLAKDSYFVCDIIGSMVYDQNNKLLGKLADVLSTGSNDVYVIKNENGEEILLPALKSVIKEISIEAGIIKVLIPEGLL